MKEKQIESAKARIDKLKKLLAEDKIMGSGEYHDGRGVRYLITEQFIKIKDYNGGIKYLTWFDKNFPDDKGYPIFLFESTFILFKCSKLMEAEQKAYQTFFSNTYLFDKFLGKEFLQLKKNESSNWEYEKLVDNLSYTNKDPEFSEFADWIEKVLSSRKFLDKAKEFFEIRSLLKNEPIRHPRSELVYHPKKNKYKS